MERFRPKPAKPLSPARRRRCIESVRQTLGVPALNRSGRRARRTLGQHRSTQRKTPQGRRDEALLTEDIIALARDYGRYGYPLAGRRLPANAVRRMITGLLNNTGWPPPGRFGGAKSPAGQCVNHKRVERIWRREGLKVPNKQPKKGRLWRNDGSCVRLRPAASGAAQPCLVLCVAWQAIAQQFAEKDFVQDRTHDGRVFRTLNIIDEYTKEALPLGRILRMRLPGDG